jgi:hypothetical protein
MVYSAHITASSIAYDASNGCIISDAGHDYAEHW